MLTLLCVQTTEGWIGVMWDSVDATGQNMIPIRDAHSYFIILYIIIIILLCLLFLNLFVGVVCETFNNEKEVLVLNNLLKPEERSWIQVQLLGYGTKPVKFIKPNS